MTIDIIEPFADEKATIQIVSNSRVKETNSQEALTTELYMVGAELVKNKDFLEITSPATLRYEAKDTLSDLRIAICFSLASLGDTPITTNGPGCTSNIPSNNLKKLPQNCFLKPCLPNHPERNSIHRTRRINFKRGPDSIC